MKNRIFSSFFLIILFSIISFSQDKPAWLGELETAIQKDGAKMNISTKVYRKNEKTNSEDYFLFVKINDNPDSQSALEIYTYNISGVGKEQFEEKVDQINKSDIWSGKLVEKQSIEVGVEGFIWTHKDYDSNKVLREGASIIVFRKGDAVVRIFSPSETSSKIPSKILSKTLADCVEKYAP